MKRLVLISEELDGHASSSTMICTTKSIYDKLIKSILYYDDELVYTFNFENKHSDKDTTFYYTGDSGYLAIRVILFNTYKEIENIEIFERTG